MRIMFDEGEIDCSDISRRDLSGAGFVDIQNGSYVYGSCFAQEIPGSRIFRGDMRGVTFRNCNLMNVHVPNGNTIIDCQTGQFALQNDGNDWVIGEDGRPVEPLNAFLFRKRGLPVPDPADIPLLPVEERIDLVAVAEAMAGL